MIAAFICYALVVGTLVALAGVAVERALRLQDRPTRWGWIGALAAALVIPEVALVFPTLGREPLELLMPGAATLAAPGRAIDGLRSDLAMLDRPLVFLWIAASVIVGLAVGVSVVRVRRARRTWRQGRMVGCAVLVSDEVGPAVVGVLRGSIVMPAWALRVESPLQKLMLAHEREHIRAGDPMLLGLALFAVILMPWNLPVWWMVGRLRLAAEIDCDARVLRDERADVGTYGSLLLEVGRRTSAVAIPAIAFSRPASALEQRIKVMTAVTLPSRRARSAGLAGIAGVVLVLTGAAPHPFGRCEPAVPPVLQEPCPDARTTGVVVGQPRVLQGWKSL